MTTANGDVRRMTLPGLVTVVRYRIIVANPGDANRYQMRQIETEHGTLRYVAEVSRTWDGRIYSEWIVNGHLDRVRTFGSARLREPLADPLSAHQLAHVFPSSLHGQHCRTNTCA